MFSTILRNTGSPFARRSLYTLCLMLFFWTLFDGVVSYITPLTIIQHGISKTLLGFIIGTSSIAGAVFDLLLSKFLRNTHFRRVYLFMFALCFIYPLVLSSAKTVWMFLIAMALWGFYYDFGHFGDFDFVGRKFVEERHASSFGLINIFKSLGYMIAPLIVGFTLSVSAVIGKTQYMLLFLFLGISFLFYLLLSHTEQHDSASYIQEKILKRLNVLREIGLWRKIGKTLLPVLLLTMFFNVFDSFFWTLGPLLSENYTALHPFNGLFLTAYTFPFLIAGMVVGSVTKKIGKKKTAFGSLMIGSLILVCFMFLHSPIFILLDVFFASLFASCALPAINGAYADYVAESSLVEKEIEALGDFFSNLGYVFGPMLAGVLADAVGTAQTFSILGGMCAIVAIVLLFTTPKKIRVSVQQFH